MSKLKKKSTDQLELRFDTTVGAAAIPLLSFPAAFKDAHRRAVDRLNAALKKHPEVARKQLPDLLAFVFGGKYSMATVNAWFSPTNANLPPLEAIYVMCFALDDWTAWAELFDLAGRALATKTDCALAELGRVKLARADLDAREAAALSLIKGGGRE